MRLAVFDDFRIGLVEEDELRDVTDVLEWLGIDAPGPHRMTALIAELDAILPGLVDRAKQAPTVKVVDVHLRPVVPAPRHVLAAPKNYRTHAEEMRGPVGTGDGTVLDLGFFLKANGSLSGPNDPIELPPLPDREFHHEAEVAFVIGKEARAVSRDRALDYVAGYTMLVDVTMRNSETRREERVMRKSFYTFAPLGPYLLTADEVPDPVTLELRLSVNGVERQHGTLGDLIVDVPGLIQHASSVLPLQPGDVFATGTPAGVGPIVPGDHVTFEVDGIGTMDLPVVRRSW